MAATFGAAAKNAVTGVGSGNALEITVGTLDVDNATSGNIQFVETNGVTINNLLPGIHPTDRAVSLDSGVARSLGISIEEAVARRAASIPARRYGTAAEFGAACAFLCSAHAGFIVGQNILLDAGAMNSTL